MDLNEHQQRAVNSTAQRILCLAGPGSGKSRVLVERIRRLIRDGTAPESIVAITFTNQAAAVITDRLGGAQLGFTGTLHSFMLKLLREHGEATGFGPGLGVLDEDQAGKLRDQVVAEAKVVATKSDIDDEVRRYAGRREKNGRGVMSQAELAAARFCHALRAANLVTFDTLLAYGLRLLEPGMAGIGGFRHLLWDEFQDSNDIDAEILMALPIANKFVVGDPDQSIYGFRGGNVENILGLSNIPGIELITLKANYRCAGRICAAANNLIGHNEDRIKKLTTSVTGEEGIITVTACENEDSELERLAAGIRAAGPTECAVLVRSNALVTRISGHLRGDGIPVAETKRPSMPPEWNKAKLLIALLNDPENDLLAEWWLEQSQGYLAAQRVRLLAQSQRMSINAHTLKLPVGLPVAAVPEALARAGIGVDTVARVRSAADQMRADAPIAYLILELAAAERDSETVGAGVTVSTIHSAKGKEWGTVFMPAFEQEIIPGAAKSRDIAEERRCAFVAMTRAKHALHISYSMTRMPPYASSRPKPATQSQFIREAGL